MPFPRESAPIERRRRQVTPPISSPEKFLNEEYLFSSLVTGPGVMAAVSAASTLQHLWPELLYRGFPVAGLMGLLLGCTLAVPGARYAARRLDPQRPGLVLCVAVLFGLILTAPAALYAPAIGWIGGATRLYIVAGVLSASGLIWGGYINADAMERE